MSNTCQLRSDHTRNITFGIRKFLGHTLAYNLFITITECGRNLLGPFRKSGLISIHPPFLVNKSCGFLAHSSSCSFTSPWLLMPFLNPGSERCSPWPLMPFLNPASERCSPWPLMPFLNPASERCSPWLLMPFLNPASGRCSPCLLMPFQNPASGRCSHWLLMPFLNPASGRCSLWLLMSFLNTAAGRCNSFAQGKQKFGLD